MSDSRLTYTVSHEAWYWSFQPLDRLETPAEVMVHREALTPEGHHDGVHWEFRIVWHQLGDGRPTPRVCLYDDAWPAFYEIPEFFGRLAKLSNSNATPEKIVGLLADCGFTDTTERKRGVA